MKLPACGALIRPGMNDAVVVSPLVGETVACAPRQIRLHSLREPQMGLRFS